MMHNNGDYYWGMHMGWWFVVLITVIVLMVFFINTRKRK